MANGKQLSQKGAEEVLDIIDSYIDVKEAVESTKKKPFNNYHSKEEEEYLTIECNNNDRFFDCMHGYIYAIPEYNVCQHKCNVQEECYCAGCNNFIPKIVKENK